MADSHKYSASLRKLYDCRKIGVGNFACCYLKSCRAAAKAHGRYLSLGSEAHVGDKYGTPIRLVVVSLDTGGRGAGLGAERILPDAGRKSRESLRRRRTRT